MHICNACEECEERIDCINCQCFKCEARINFYKLLAKVKEDEN